MDITDQLSTIEIPEWKEPSTPIGTWTDAKLVAVLQTYGVGFTRTQTGKYALERCPLCNESEGNPAVWVAAGKPVFKCHRERHCGGKTFRDLQALFARPQLAVISGADLISHYRIPRESVVEDFIRRGDVVNIIGGPKARKSFLVMQFGLAVASGTPFIGWTTNRGRVLMIDNELRHDDLARRLAAMSKELGLNQEEVLRNIDIMALRGKLADVQVIKSMLSESPRDTYSAVILDALYKALPADVDENSNSNITKVYTQLDALAEELNCATVIVHHTSKGNQNQKSVSDMGAGAGAQSRSADVHMVLRDHESKDTVVAHAIVRSQRPVEPRCLTFRYPVWELALHENPERITSPNKKPLPSIEDFVATIPIEPARKNEVLAASKSQLNTSKATMEALLTHSVKEGLVEIIKPKNKKHPHTIRRTARPRTSSVASR